MYYKIDVLHWTLGSFNLYRILEPNKSCPLTYVIKKGKRIEIPRRKISLRIISDSKRVVFLSEDLRVPTIVRWVWDIYEHTFSSIEVKDSLYINWFFTRFFILPMSSRLLVSEWNSSHCWSTFLKSERTVEDIVTLLWRNPIRPSELHYS